MASFAILAGALALPLVGQDRDREYREERVTRIEPGTVLTVRTQDYITSRRSDGRVYYGNVDQDVFGSNGRLAIPRGSRVEMIVRVERDNDLNLDLESVTVNGVRYALDANEHLESQQRPGQGERTAERAGGGAVLGAIIGAIAGGGKGAAIGAGAGAAAGAGSAIITRGREVRVPAESILTFRLERPLVVGVEDRGNTREGQHYHEGYDRQR
jgi:hypothetical protein